MMNFLAPNEPNQLASHLTIVSVLNWNTLIKSEMDSVSPILYLLHMIDEFKSLNLHSESVSTKNERQEPKNTLEN